MRKLLFLLLLFSLTITVFGQIPNATDKEGQPIVNLAYLELCDDMGHLHINIPGKHIEGTIAVNVMPDWEDTEYK